MEQPIQNIEKLKGLVNNLGITMLVTVNEAKELTSRHITTADIDTERNMWFFTDGSSNISEEISLNNEVLITYSSCVLKRYISIYGNASLGNDIDQIKDLWNPAFKPWFPEAEKYDTVMLLKVNQPRIEYWHGGSSKRIINSSIKNIRKKKGSHNTLSLYS